MSYASTMQSYGRSYAMTVLAVILSLVNFSPNDFKPSNTRVSGGLLMEAAIMIPVSLLVSAVLIPAAFSSIYGADTTGWNAAVITVFQILLPVLAVLGVAYQFIREITGS